MKETFITALGTLYYSWGGDTPQEAIWAANQFLDFYEEVFKIKLSGRFTEDDYLHNEKLMVEITKS